MLKRKYFLIVPIYSIKLSLDRESRLKVHRLTLYSLYKIMIDHFFYLIDPRTASATRALLRLLPCHRTYPSSNTEVSGIPGFLEVTGGEYRTRERIHRGIADPRLLAIPTSWRQVAASNLN